MSIKSIHSRIRAVPIHSILLALALLAAPGLSLAAEMPDWVKGHGVSGAYPTSRYLLGIGQGSGGEEATESAKQQAAADLARQISVQIESSVVDVTNEKKGRLENDLTSRIRATSDVRLEGIRFEIYRKRKKVWALAVLERQPAAAARREQRDQAMLRTRRCLTAAAEEEKAGRARQALDAYRSCRKPLDEALENEAVAAAIQRGALLQDQVGEQLAAHATRISARIRAIPHEDAHSIRAAANALATQLARAGIGRGIALQSAPLLYQGRDVSSPLGRELALALESAIGQTEPSGSYSSGLLVLRGSYREDGENFQIRVSGKEARTGRLIASAEITLAGSGVPEGMQTRPANFDRFTQDADKLAGGEVVSGDLRVEVRTNKGMHGIVYEEGEELTISVRVNRPAWLRLIYVLTSGDHVPITQEWYLDESKVNQLIEYPISFEVVAPFGIEMIHAMASTEKPRKLTTRSTSVDGESYEIIPGGADQVVRTRGIARKKKQQVVEQTLKLTTLARER